MELISESMLGQICAKDIKDVAQDYEEQTVVRVTTTCWADKNGYSCKKQIRFMRRKCTGFNLLSQEIEIVSNENLATLISNLNEVEDGLYDVSVIGYDTGSDGEQYDFQFELTPYSEAF